MIAERGPEEAGGAVGWGTGEVGAFGCIPGRANSRDSNSNMVKAVMCLRTHKEAVPLLELNMGTAKGMRPDRGRCARYT